MTAEAAPTASPPRIRHILLGLDPTSHDPAILEQVAALAQRLRADIRMLFVEDEAALTLADNPAVRMVSTITATAYRMDRTTVERSQRGRIAASRLAIDRVMAARRVTARFEMRHGIVVDELITCAQDADLIVLGWGSRGLGKRGAHQPSRPGSVACAVAERADVPVLLLLPTSPKRGPTVVAFDGTSAAGRAIDTAIDLFANGNAVIAALMSDSTTQVQRWQSDLSVRHAGRLRFQHVPNGNPATLIATARQAGASMLVLSTQGPDCCGGPTRRILDTAGCSILLVR